MTANIQDELDKRSHYSIAICERQDAAELAMNYQDYNQMTNVDKVISSLVANRMGVNFKAHPEHYVTRNL